MEDNNKDYKLNFTVPQGPIGPIGSLTPAYGGLYQTVEKSYDIQNLIFKRKPYFNNATAENNVILNLSDNSITILEAGIYDISFKIDLTSNTGVNMAVISNGINGLQDSKYLPAGDINVTTFESRTITRIEENTIIFIAFSPDRACTITSNLGYLIVKKIDDI